MPPEGGRTATAQRFEALVTEHADVVWRFAMSMLANPADADDVTQDTFVRALDGLDTFRGEASHRTWLLTICRNLCIDHLRRRREVPDLDAVTQTTARDGSAHRDHAEDVTTRALLEAGLADLSPDEREAFVLVDVLGFSGADAAAVCDVPATTLRSRRQRAHDALVGLLTGGEA